MITKLNTSAKEPVPFLVKVRDVAQLLSVSRATVHALIDTGELKASPISPQHRKKRVHVRIERDSLLAFYKKRFGRPLDQALQNPFRS